MNLFPSFVIDKRRFYTQKSTHLFFVFSKGRNSKLTNNSLQMLLIGVCLGVTLGIAFVPLNFDTDCYNGSSFFEQLSSNNVPIPGISDISAYKNFSPLKTEFEEKSDSVNIDSKLKYLPQYRPPKMRRPRFFSTELGLRKKLIAGVILSDSSHLNYLLAINKTLSSQVNKLLFFVTGSSLGKKLKLLGIPGVISLSESTAPSQKVVSVEGGQEDLNRPKYNKAALKAIKYFGDKFIDNYDYFFLTLDLFYVNGKALMNSVKSISISEDVLWGFPDNDGSDGCNLENGLVMSRGIVQKLSSRVDRCLTSSLLNLSGNLTKCVHYLAKLTCVNVVQGQTYMSAPVSSSAQFSQSLTIGPVSSHDEIFEVHAEICQQRKIEISKYIEELSKKIEELAPKTLKPSEILTWPSGIAKQNVPRIRFDVLKWKFFTVNEIFPENDYVTMSSNRDGINALDIPNVIHSSVQYLRTKDKKREFKEIQFQHGYRRFDPTRGMEYILDFADKTGHTSRVEGLRPISKIEVVPMPYVTENRRLTIIVPVTSENINQTHEFLDRYFDFSVDRKPNTVVVLALVVRKLSENSSPSLKTDQIEKIKQLLSQYNANQQKREGVSTTTAAENVKAGYIIVNLKHSKIQNYPLVAIDTLTKRVVSPNSIILTLDLRVNVKDDFLNRVRMNTVFNCQVFSSIPFVAFNSKISQRPEQHGKDADITKNTGYFDSEQFRFLSFYAADYLTVRRAANSVTISKSEKLEDFSALLYLFIRGSQLHIFRAPEPGLRLRFSLRASDCVDFEKCTKTRWGSKSQLAKLILSSRSQL